MHINRSKDAQPDVVKELGRRKRAGLAVAVEGEAYLRDAARGGSAARMKRRLSNCTSNR